MIYKVSVALHKDFVEVNGDEIKIGIQSEPQKGKANKELLEKISKHFKISKSHIRIISGEKSRKKIIEIV
jgi:hypothetical protein